MIDVFELADAQDPSDILDVITVDGVKVSYQTGAAETLIRARQRLIPDWEQMVLSLDGWSNGYLVMRRAGGSDVAG